MAARAAGPTLAAALIPVAPATLFRRQLRPRVEADLLVTMGSGQSVVVRARLAWRPRRTARGRRRRARQVAPVEAAPLPTPQPAQPSQPAKPKKPKEVYYNIVGEPIESDDE